MTMRPELTLALAAVSALVFAALLLVDMLA